MWRYVGLVDRRPTNLLAPGSFLWLFRLAWVGLAVVMAFALHQPTSRIAWWAVVAAVAVALTASGPVGLTVARLATSVTLPAAVLAWWGGASSGTGVAAVAVAALVTVVGMSAEVGEAMVQGAAYGEEQRFPLRLPAAMLAPVGLSWLIWAASLLGSVALLARSVWLPGAVLAAAAAFLSWWLGTRFHRLARRWLVLVPAGVVVHDQVLLAETLMVQRSNLAGARLALAGSEAFDLTGPAGGHALDIAAREMVQGFFPASAKEPTGRAVHMQSFLVAPSRPGRALQAIAGRKMPVG